MLVANSQLLFMTAICFLIMPEFFNKLSLMQQSAVSLLGHEKNTQAVQYALLTPLRKILVSIF